MIRRRPQERRPQSPLKEFSRGEDDHGLTVGGEVEVFVDRVENADGEAIALA